VINDCAYILICHFIAIDRLLHIQKHSNSIHYSAKLNAKAGAHTLKKEFTVTDENIEKAYIIMAQIIQKYGDKYLPIFKRIHEEREARKANQDLKNIALQVASNMQ